MTAPVTLGVTPPNNTSLVSFGSSGSGSNSTGIGSRLDVLSNIGNDEILEGTIPRLSTKEYNSQDANDYVRGIAATGIMILALYLIWGLVLDLLRVGRIDCLCQMKCCRRSADDTSTTNEDGDIKIQG